MRAETGRSSNTHPPNFYPTPAFDLACRSSRCLSLLWQWAQRLCQLYSSQNNSISPRCGVIWSTTVAGVVTPFAWQYTHNGWRNRNSTRALRHWLPYPRSADDLLPRQLSADLIDGIVVARATYSRPLTHLSPIPLTISPEGIARCQSAPSHARSNRTRRTYPSTQYLLI